MIRFIHDSLFAFDVEWVPDPKSAELLHGVQPGGPGSVEDAYRALWADAGATPERPQPFLKTMLCRVVSLSGIFRERGEDGPKLKLVSMPNDCSDPAKCTEASILSTFFKAVGKRKPQLVGYNSVQADVPILVERAVAHGLPSHGFAERPSKPWEGVDYFSNHSDYHVDLATSFGRWNMMPRLHEAATVSGIPGKLGVSGESVAEMWLMGNVEGIVHYNEYDAFTTYLLWARVAHFCELLDAEAYEREQQLVRELLEAEIAGGAEHLVLYLESWDRLRASIAERG